MHVIFGSVHQNTRVKRDSQPLRLGDSPVSQAQSLRNVSRTSVVAWFPTPSPDVQFTVQLFLFTFWCDIVPAYTERLKARKLPTLHYRHIRGDMIEMYKILSGKYDTALIPRVNREHGSITRGSDLRLQKARVA